MPNPSEETPDRADPTQPVVNVEDSFDTGRTNPTRAVQREPENQRRMGAEKPPPYQPPVPFPQRLAEPKTCCAVNVVDQLAKGQLREGYESSVKNYPDYLSELQVETSKLESICTADVRTDNLKELGHGPDGSHTDRAPHFEELNREAEPDKADIRVLHGSNTSDTDRAKAHTKQPTPELKPFPANLRYEFLDPDNSFFVIVSADLKLDRTATLLEKLKAHTGAIECSIMDLKEILWILLMQEFDRVVHIPQKWVLPPVPPDQPFTNQ